MPEEASRHLPLWIHSERFLISSARPLWHEQVHARHERHERHDEVVSGFTSSSIDLSGCTLSQNGQPLEKSTTSLVRLHSEQVLCPTASAFGHASFGFSCGISLSAASSSSSVASFTSV